MNLNFDLNTLQTFSRQILVTAEEGFLEQSKPSTLNMENYNALRFVH